MEQITHLIDKKTGLVFEIPLKLREEFFQALEGFYKTRRITHSSVTQEIEDELIEYVENQFGYLIFEWLKAWRLWKLL